MTITTRPEPPVTITTLLERADAALRAVRCAAIGHNELRMALEALSEPEDLQRRPVISFNAYNGEREVVRPEIHTNGMPTEKAQQLYEILASANSRNAFDAICLLLEASMGLYDAVAPIAVEQTTNLQKLFELATEISNRYNLAARLAAPPAAPAPTQAPVQAAPVPVVSNLVVGQ